jgi:LCP family protein required for cell wall assembly
MKLLVAAIAIAVAAILFFVFKLNNFYYQIYKPKTKNSPTVSPNKSSYNILVVGYGGGKHEGTYLTDTMILTHVDLKRKKAFLISLPRDMWVRLPTKSGSDYHTKINAVYQIGLFPDDFPDIKISKDNSALINQAVAQITGLSVDYLVAVDFEGFKKAIDVLEGIDIYVQQTFDDYRYPIDGKETELCGKEEEFKLIEKFITPPYDEEEKKKLLEEKPELNEYLKNATESPHMAFPCRYEHLHFDKGLTHMDGETALKYVRSRYGIQDGSDFGRAARQQLFIKAVKEKVLNIAFIPRVIPLLNELKDNISIDIGPEQMQRFLKEANQMGDYQIVSFILSDENYLKEGYSINGQYVLMPKGGIDRWAEVKTAIKNMVEGITPTPEASPSAR